MAPKKKLGPNNFTMAGNTEIKPFESFFSIEFEFSLDFFGETFGVLSLDLFLAFSMSGFK